MGTEITLITAFFNIGRENFKVIPRSDEKYMKNFEFWARMKNNLIIYTFPEAKNRVLSIRENYGLLDKTTVIVIENIFEIEPEIFNRMKEISTDQTFIDFRLMPHATSNIAAYSYLMLLKSYFLKDAVERNLTVDQVAWIDFGFNHGGDLYLNAEEFAFEWKHEFEPFIYYFYYKRYDNRPIFEIVRRLSDCIMGCLIVAPATMCDELWQLNKGAMKTLNDVGLIDDDQLIHLMSYRKKSSIFKLVESKWFLPLKEYGGSTLVTLYSAKSKPLIDLLKRIRRTFKKRRMAWKNAAKLYSNLTRKNDD